MMKMMTMMMKKSKVRTVMMKVMTKVTNRFVLVMLEHHCWRASAFSPLHYLI